MFKYSATSGKLSSQMEKKRTKADVTSERILEISLKAFHKRGYAKTTMRDLADACGLSPGAFYYHFESKEEIIQVFYEQTLTEFIGDVEKIAASTSSFEKRLVQSYHKRFDTFRPSRELLVVLSSAAVDPTSALSPFNEGQSGIRERTIELMKMLIEGSDLNCDKRLLPYLPSLFWMLLMAFVFYWVFDTSKNQKRTDDLIDLLTPQIVRLIRFSRLPLTGTVIDPILKTLELAIPHQKKK